MGKNMNTSNVSIAIHLLSVALLAVGCGGESAGARTPTAATAISCGSDAACESGFCDRGLCAKPGPNLTYGAQCDPTPPGGYDRCGGYLCIEHRCRSCTQDAECKEGSPVSTCNDYADEPGRSCGRKIEPGPPQPPPPEFPLPPSTP